MMNVNIFVSDLIYGRITIVNVLIFATANSLRILSSELYSLVSIFADYNTR